MSMFRTLILISALYIVSGVASNVHLHPLSDEFIESINFNQNTWIAGRNFHKDTPLKYIRNLMGTLRDYQMEGRPRNNHTCLRKKKYPKYFDARKRWQNCPTLNDIRDQGGCGSCWAVAAVSAMTDRVCIHSKGEKNFYFSAEDVLSCCIYCGKGCDGGILRRAWSFYRGDGIVSGGSYNSSQGCQPYAIPPCKHNVLGERTQCGPIEKTPKCQKVCDEKYKVTYINNKHRGKRPYNVKRCGINGEIYKNGPVTSYFKVYEDFLNYKSGVYNYTTGKYIGIHSVKLIGWGEENGMKYWLAANSWNIDWGDNGFFKINSEGVGSCGISDNVVAGICK